MHSTLNMVFPKLYIFFDYSNFFVTKQQNNTSKGQKQYGVVCIEMLTFFQFRFSLLFMNFSILIIFIFLKFFSQNCGNKC